MKKTITAITLLSFTFLSLNVHMHEHEHAEHADHASDYNTVEENCDFCQFNSDNSFTEASTCLLYTSPSPRDAHESRMPSSA